MHTDFEVISATGVKVAELSLNHGPTDTTTPSEDLAATRADALLIAHAPEDLAALAALLDLIAEEPGRG